MKPVRDWTPTQRHLAVAGLFAMILGVLWLLIRGVLA